MRYMKVSWDSRPSANSFLSSPTAWSRSASEERSDSGVVGVSAVDPPMNGVSAPSGLRARGRPGGSVQADARVEHRVENVHDQVLDDDDPAERGADVEAGQGNHGGERSAQRVPGDQAVFAHPLGPGRPDVILAQYLEHRRAGQPGIRG